MEPRNQTSQSTLLEGVSWQTFERLLAEAERPRPRFAYAAGVLEIMTTSQTHEFGRSDLSRLILALTEELAIPARQGCSPTLKSNALERAFEPDDCFWIENEPLTRAPAFDPIRPPPDLVLESEYSCNILHRLSILAALRIPEVWRYDQESLSVILLGADGEYAPSSSSRAFPWLPLDRLEEYLRRSRETDQTSWILGFREWVRTDLAPRVREG